MKDEQLHSRRQADNADDNQCDARIELTLYAFGPSEMELLQDLLRDGAETGNRRSNCRLELAFYLPPDLNKRRATSPSASTRPPATERQT